MALEKHFADACCSAEIAVDLEWWVGTEEVRICSADMLRLGIYLRVCAMRVLVCRVEEAAEQLESSVAVAQASPEIHLPGPAPASRLISSTFERLSAGLCKFRGLGRRNLVAGMETI